MKIFDLIILNHFKQASELFEEIKKSKIFRNVYYYDDTVLKNNKWKEIKAVLFNDLKKIFECKNIFDYDNLIISNQSIFSDVLFGYMHKKNNNINIYIIEDGMATYVKKLAFNESGKMFVLRKVLRKPMISHDYIKKIYVYDKELISYKTDAEVENIPKINNETLNLLKKIFKDNLKYNEALKCKNIYFDQPFTVDKINIDERMILQNLIKKIKYLTLKVHPRQKKEIYCNINYELYNEKNNMWEIEISNYSKTDNINLISVNSTCVFTPTLLYGYKFKIFILDKIVENYLDTNNFDIFLEKFIEKYGDIVHQVKTYEALGDLINE